MRKLRLDLDKLHVESFSITASPPPAGTVNGRALEPNYREVPATYDTCDSGAGGGGAYTVGTCVGPTFCCPPTWKVSCDSCAHTYCNNSACNGSCFASCVPGTSCTDGCTNCSP